MIEPHNGDVLVEPETVADGTVWYRVISVGSAQRVAFGTEVTAARAYACREARRHGTRALERTPVGYQLVAGAV